MTQIIGTINIPADWLLLNSTALSLITIVVTFTGFRYFTNLNFWYRLIDSVISSIFDKITKIKAFIEGGFHHPNSNLDP